MKKQLINLGCLLLGILLGVGGKRQPRLMR